MTQNQVDFTSLIRKDLVFFGVKGENWEDFLHNVAAELEKAGAVKPSYDKALQDREREFPTGLYLGDVNFALPHTYPENIIENAIALVIPESKVRFKRMDDPDDTVDISVAVCPLMEKMDQNVKILPSLMKFFASEKNISDLISQDDPEKVIEMIKERVKEG